MPETGILEHGGELAAAHLAATPIAEFVSINFYWVFIAVLVLNMTQRRHQNRAQRKRFATLYIGLALFAFWLAATLILEFNGADWMMAPVALVIGGVCWYYRRAVFPFRLTSRRDGRRLSLNEILYDDEDGDRDAHEAESGDRHDETE